MIPQTWKLSWTVNGIRAEEEEVTVNGQTSLRLNHSFFVSDSFKAYTKEENGEKKFLVVFPTDVDNQSVADIILSDVILDFNSVTGKTVYSKIVLQSDKAKSLEKFFVDVTYLGDILDPADFQQSLTPESDVSFNSITTQAITAEEISVKKFKTFNEIQGQLLSSQDNSLLLKVETEFRKKVTLKDALKVPANFSLQIGENDEIKIEENNIYINKGSHREQTLLKSLSLDKIPVFGIPVILADNKTVLNFVDFLKLAPEIKGIFTQGIKLSKTEKIVSSEIRLGETEDTFMFYLGGYVFLQINKETKKATMFNGLISFDLEKNEVEVNRIKIDTSFFEEIRSLRREVAALRAMITKKGD